MGDLLFAVVNVARHLGVEPETALRAATHKFRARFEGVERLAAERGIDLHTAGLAVLDALWDEVKASGADRPDDRNGLDAARALRPGSVLAATLG